MKDIEIDGKKYQYDDTDEKFKDLIDNILFTDEQINQLKNEFAVADTARIGYMKALKKELPKQ